MPRKVLQLVLLSLLLSACRNEPKEEDLPLGFDTETIVETSAEGCDPQELNCAVIRLEILRPRGTEEVIENISNTLEEHLTLTLSTEENPSVKEPEALARDFISGYQRISAEFEEAMPHRALINQSLYSHTDELVSIGVDSQVYTGGAHGYRSLSFFNFDPDTGEEFSHEDLFTEEFTAYAEKVFREQEGIPADQNINSTGLWFENDAFHLPQNIGFEEDQVILVYNPYEIASYASGEFYLEIPKAELRDYLKLEQE